MNTVPRKLFLPQESADTLSIHPLAKVFPPLSVKEFEALVADIEAHGLREAITLYEGQILDGIHRYAACCKAKVEPWAVDFGGDRAAAVAFVISKNALRRHLTPAGKRKAIEALLQANPEQSDRQIAKVVQASPTTVGATRSKMEAKGDVSKLDTRRDSKGRRQVARKPRPSNRATKKGRKSRAAAAPASTSDSATTSAPTSSTTPAPTSSTTAAPTPAAAAPTSATAAVTAGEQNLVATLRDEKRRLEIKCVALESEVTDLKAVIEKPLTRDTLVDALVKWVVPTKTKEEREFELGKLMRAVLATADTAASATSKTATPAISQWQIKTRKYVNGWSWSATDGSVSLNSNPAALFATQAEAEGDARAAIAGAKEKAA
jgi:ParB-like chromosome segregation protein Spo0J